MFLSTALAVFLTGVTEPIEFMFMFTSPILYFGYAIFTGLAFAMADLINLRIHAFGFIELLTRTPMIINAGLLKDLLNFVFTCLLFFTINFFGFKFAIKKFNILTPGRGENTLDTAEEEVVATNTNTNNKDLAIKVIELLGGRDNIVDVDACMTRLRVTVKDTSLVSNQAKWKENGAVGLIIKDKGIQAIYGPKADILKSDINDILGA